MIPPEPSFGLVNGRPLFLDLHADSYFMLEARDEADLLRALRSEDPSSSTRPVAFTRPTAQLQTSGATSLLRLTDVWLVGLTLRQIRRSLARKPLALVIAGAQAKRARRGTTVSPRLLANRFTASRRWLPQTPNCLTDSLALLAFLARHGATAELVFGAKLDPFAAHCWVQVDTLLLNDSIDRIEPFTPVAVIAA